MGRYRIAGVDLGQAHDPSALVMLEREMWDERGKFGPIDERVKVVSIRQFPLDMDYTVQADEMLAYSPDAMIVEVNGPGRPMIDLLRRRARERGYKGRIHGVVTAASHVRPKLIQDEDKGKMVVIPKGELIFAINELQRRGCTYRCSECKRDLPGPGVGCSPLHIRCTKCHSAMDAMNTVCGKRVKKRDGTLLDCDGVGELSLHHGFCAGQGVAVGGGLVITPELAGLWRMVTEQMKTFSQKQNQAGNISFDAGGSGHHGDLVIALGIACWWMNRFFKSKVSVGIFFGDEETVPWTGGSIRGAF